jgi:hypothetical protein
MRMRRLNITRLSWPALQALHAGRAQAERDYNMRDARRSDNPYYRKVCVKFARQWHYTYLRCLREVTHVSR